jgi:hypothetical protein
MIITRTRTQQPQTAGQQELRPVHLALGRAFGIARLYCCHGLSSGGGQNDGDEEEIYGLLQESIFWRQAGGRADASIVRDYDSASDLNSKSPSTKLLSKIRCPQEWLLQKEKRTDREVDSAHNAGVEGRTLLPARLGPRFFRRFAVCFDLPPFRLLLPDDDQKIGCWINTRRERSKTGPAKMCLYSTTRPESTASSSWCC